MENVASLRVLVLDENPALVEGLGFLINSTKYLRAVKAHAAQCIPVMIDSLMPDVLVVDPVFLRRSSQTVSTLQAQHNNLRALAYCNLSDTTPSEHYLDRGYSGIVARDCESQKLLKAITVVGFGGTIIETNPAVVSDGERPITLSTMPAAIAASPLTEREESVLKHVAMGRATKEIAADIQLSQKTVETYKARAVRKLSLNSRSDIVQYALRAGWL